MNVTISIQDCTLQELQTLFARLTVPVAAMPAPEPAQAFQPAPAAPPAAPAPTPAEDPAPTAEPAPRRGRPSTAKQRLHEQQAERQVERQRQEQELAAVVVTGENGIREPLGKAIERLQAEKRAGHVKPVAGRHDDGTLRWWPTQTDAAREIGVSPERLRQCIRDCIKLRGWMLEEDDQQKGGAR